MQTTWYQLIATTEKDLKELVDIVFTASMKAGLSINKEKTKVIVSS